MHQRPPARDRDAAVAQPLSPPHPHQPLPHCLANAEDYAAAAFEAWLQAGTISLAGFAAAASLDPAVLARPFTPPQHLYGLGDPREMTPREAIVESIRHLAIHLGEFRLTRSLAVNA